MKVVYCILIGGYFVDTAGMTYIKMVKASRAYIYQFQKLKGKLYSCNVKIYINQKCFYNNLVSDFDMSFVLTVCVLIYTYYIDATGTKHIKIYYDKF